MEKTTFTVLSCIPKPTRASALKLKKGGCAKELATHATDDFMNSTTTAARIAILFAIAIMFHTAVLAQGNNYEGPVGVTGIFNGNVTTGCSYDPLTQSAHRVIDDIVVPGSIGKYPLKMTRYYNSRQQYYAGSAIGLSPGWAHEYSWLLWGAGHKVVSPHGNVSDDYCGPPVGVSETWEGSHSENTGTWRLADGGRVIFGNGHVTITDPYGLTTTLDYSSNGLWRVTEPGGRCLIFTYNATEPADGTRLLTNVEAFDFYNGHRIDVVSYSYTSVFSGGYINGHPVNKMMLTGVSYSDGTSATYNYTTDNVPENGTSHKLYPLLSTANDKRYNGPMRQIAYDYSNGSPHGVIYQEKYNANGPLVSQIEPAVPLLTADGPMPNEFTETRGDGPSRTFHYTNFNQHHRCEGCGICEDYEANDHWPDRGPQQVLKWYTDFQGLQGHTTWLDYDSHWYVNSVTDARGSGPGDASYTTTYTRGPPPPQGIGQIKKITHPDGYFIQYDYEDPTPQNGDPHYITRITDERGNKTEHIRDGNHRIIHTDHKDSQGNILAYEEFQYNNFGQVKTHHLPSTLSWNGPYEHFQYDSRGLLIVKTNPTTIADWQQAINTAPKTTYVYYATENSYTAGDGQTVYPWADRVKTVTLPANGSNLQAWNTYEYDRVLDGSGITNLSGGARPGRGLVTKITHADTPSNTYETFKYDAYGNKRWEDNELRKATSYTYDDYNRLLSVTNPLGKTTSYDYAPSQGNVTQSRRHTSNSPYWITVPVNATTSILTSNVYDENFRKTSTTSASGTSEAATTWFHYDNVGNQDYVTDPRGAGSGDSNYTTYSDYDSRNRKWRRREPLNQTTIFGYDEGHNITEIRRPDNQLETKTYDAMNRLITHTVPKTPTVSLTTRFGYWPTGKLFWEQDPEGQTTYFGYNESDQMNLMYYPGLTQSQQWTYDDAHNLQSRTTVNGEIQSFTYDIRNRKTSMSWSNAADSATFTYYSDGRLKNAQNANSTVYREYDDAGRLTRDQQNVTGLGIKDVYYPSYDDSGKLTRMYVSGVSGYDYTFGYDEMGRFETIAPTNQSVAFQYYYDPASNEIQRRNYLSNPDLDQFYHRDNLSRIWQLEIKKGATLLGREDYGYDELNRLISTTREDNKQDQFDYYFDGELKTATYGRNSAPTPTPPASPTPAPSPTATPGGQVAEPSFAPPGTNIYPNTFVTVTISTTTTGAQIRYTLDGASWTTIANNGTVTFQPGVAGKTLTAIGFKAGLNDSDPHSEYYWYDSGRLAPEIIRTVTYHFDGAGNRTSVVDAGVTTPYTLDPNNNFNQYSQVGPDAVTNGSEHEISMYQNVSYAYINDEHLKSASNGATTYRLYYDALGRCVKRTVNGVTTYYIYDGEKPILEYRANDLTHPVRNVYGKSIDEILMRTDPTVNGAAPFYCQQDHEGSVTHLTNAVGSVLEKYRYDAFGLPTVYDGAGNLRPGGTIYKNRFLYTGREYAATYAAAFKFYEYRARAYNPILGRFMSEDPKLFDAGDYNLFRYCHNDPIDFTDPMGLDTAGPASTSSQERLWDRQKHFDRSNGAIATGLREQLVKTLGKAAHAVSDFLTATDKMTGGPEYRALVGKYREWGDKNRAALPRWLQTAMQVINDTGGVGLGVPVGGVKTVGEFTKVFRVWGDGSKPWGPSWTPVDPRTIPNYRNDAGLPNQNSGRFLSEGILRNTEGVTAREAMPLHGGDGGLRELQIRHAEQQVQLQNVQGLNPPF